LELLKPTRIYVKPVLKIIDKFEIKGIAHITGGGLLENIPRILPENLQAVVDKKSWEKPKIFDIIKEAGDIAEKEMYRTFNMGIGMVLIINPAEQDELLSEIAKLGEKAQIIGQIKKGEAEGLEIK